MTKGTRKRSLSVWLEVKGSTTIIYSITTPAVGTPADKTCTHAPTSTNRWFVQRYNANNARNFNGTNGNLNNNNVNNTNRAQAVANLPSTHFNRLRR